MKDGKEKKKVLVMGGTGRVGASTLRALAKGGDLHLFVGGRNRYKVSSILFDALEIIYYLLAGLLAVIRIRC